MNIYFHGCNYPSSGGSETSTWANNKAYQLDGVDERFQSTSTASDFLVSGAANYSVVFTINIDMTRTKNATLFSFFDGTATGKFEGYWINSVFRFYVGSAYISVSPTRALKNYHIAFVYDGTELTDTTKAKIYVDGVLLAGTAVNTVPTTIPTAISTQVLGIASRTGVPANFFDEKLAEVTFYNKTLTATEVSDLYNAGAYSDPTAISGCVSSWWFGDNAFDSNSVVVDNADGNSLTPINIESGDIIDF